MKIIVDQDSKQAGERFAYFVQIVKSLRNPEGGCPWDLEQDHKSLRPYLIEECYEVLEAIDLGSDAELSAELGDLLLQVVLHSQVSKDRSAFNISEVVNKVSEKMIRRHPHVFGDVTVGSSSEVIKNWEQIKQNERKSESAKGTATNTSRLAGIPKNMPALIRALRLGEKAAKANFDWDELSGVWAKVNEEFSELKTEFDSIPEEIKDLEPKLKQRLSHELGDLLFSICQLSRWLGLSAEDSLRECCERFTERFVKMEELSSRPITELSENELDELWNKAKAILAK